jgi:hypothetical protein
MTDKEIELRYALKVARRRAIELGDRLIEHGYPDMNRGQFLSLVDSALEDDERND